MRLSILALLLVFFVPSYSVVFAYSPETTHRGLTRDTVRLFNYHNENKITESESRLIEQGAVDEDVHTRPLNHFFDPIYNRGIAGGVTSKRWAKDTKLQSGMNEQGAAISAVTSYFGSESDYSWDRAVYEYVHGDKERALETLGHVIHLIQDASVPDHTRNDAHPPLLHFGSPYEAWANQFDYTNILISKELIKMGMDVPKFNSLGMYFDNLTRYSNAGFFSKDTITNKEYEFPDLNKLTSVSVNNKVYAVSSTTNKSSDQVYLLQQKESKNGIKFMLEDDLVMSSYWNLLSREAVLHGAGVIELFFREVEREKETLALLKKNESVVAKALANVLLPFQKIIDRFSENDKDKKDIEKKIVDTGVQTQAQQDQKTKQKPIIGEPLPEDLKPIVPTGPTLEDLQKQLNQASALLAFLQAQIQAREKKCIENSVRGPWDNFWWVGDKPGCNDPTPWIQKMFWAPIQGVGGASTSASGSISANPSSGFFGPTQITWSTSGVSDCLVTRTGDFSLWSGVSGDELYMAAFNTTFTLTCDDGALVETQDIEVDVPFEF